MDTDDPVSLITCHFFPIALHADISECNPAMNSLYALTALLSLALSASAQSWAKTKLESSPRHQEWVDVKYGSRKVHCFIVYPEVSDKAPAVLVIHENKGLTDWVRDAADQFAAAGYIAIAPDLLSGMGPKNGGTSEFLSQDSATAAIYKLPQRQVTEDLKATADYVKNFPRPMDTLLRPGFAGAAGNRFVAPGRARI